MKNPKEALRTKRRAQTFAPSMTKPGQSLHPSELLKRHLAGTLPDIEKKPEYTFDENGKQIGEDLSHLELHELHDVAQKVRAEYDKRAKELRDENEKKYRQTLIDDYKKEHEKQLLENKKQKAQPKQASKPQGPTPTPEPPAL